MNRYISHPRQLAKKFPSSNYALAPMRLAKIIICLFTVAGIFLIGWHFLYAASEPGPQIYVFKQPTATTNTSTAASQKITLIAVGDIMLSRNVEQKMINKKDWLYPFRETYQATTKGDIVFGNLETPIIEGPIVQTGTMVFRTDPQAIAGLEYGGFNILSLANNHMKNQGEKGIASTIEELDKAGIKHIGAGLNATEAGEPAIIEAKATTFGFLAYNDGSFSPASYEATESRSGSPFLNTEKLISDIQNLKSQADVIIVSMHAGTEYNLQPNQKQIDFAHTAIDNGAQLVIGHHPHVLEPYEKYNGGYIFYSLGNFIFDQMWSENTRHGAIAKIIFSQDRIESFELTPVKIYDYSQPKIAEGTQAEEILSQIQDFTK